MANGITGLFIGQKKSVQWLNSCKEAEKIVNLVKIKYVKQDFRDDTVTGNRNV